MSGSEGGIRWEVNTGTASDGGAWGMGDGGGKASASLPS